MVDAESGEINQRKGEAYMNWYSPVMTYLLRCNTDVTSLLSGTAVKSVIAYTTDYITKPGLKTHTIFQAVKDVFSRSQEMLMDNALDAQTKARKVILKTVNALTGKSEIGAPMAAMYLLDHPDHYTSHRFRRFYWHSFAKYIDSTWKTSTSDLGAETKEEKVFPSLNAVALYLRELNPEYKASAGSLHNIMKRGGLYKGIFLVRYLV